MGNNNNKVVVLDTETTGLPHSRPAPSVVQLAAVVAQSSCVVELFETMIRPVRGKPWPHSSPFHSVTNEAATRDGIPALLALTQLGRMIERHGVDTILAYNAPFDREMLRLEIAKALSITPLDPEDERLLLRLQRCSWRCVLKQARAGLSKSPCPPPSFKLCDVHGHLKLGGADATYCWHDAASDALAALDVHLKIKADTGVCAIDPDEKHCCGSMTRAGTPCKRSVPARGVRCFQHRT